MALAHQCAISLLKNAAAPYSATLAARLHRYKPLPDRYRLWEVIVQQHQNDDPLTCQIAWRNRLTPSKGPNEEGAFASRYRSDTVSGKR